MRERSFKIPIHPKPFVGVLHTWSNDVIYIDPNKVELCEELKDQEIWVLCMDSGLRIGISLDEFLKFHHLFF